MNTTANTKEVKYSALIIRALGKSTKVEQLMEIKAKNTVDKEIATTPCAQSLIIYIMRITKLASILRATYINSVNLDQ